MNEPGSVTGWLDGLRAQDPAAVRAVWDRFFERMVRRARDRLRDTARRAADEEDVALSAFDGFVRAAAAGRFPKLEDRDDLWQCLLVVTERKAADLARKERAAARGGGDVRGESVFAADPGAAGLDGRPGADPPASLVARLAEDFEQRLAALGDDTLRRVAALKLEGYETGEVAAALAMSPRTVERKVALIRQIWSQAEGASGDDASTG